MNVREEIESEFELESFADKVFDEALIGVVEQFGGDVEPLYDWGVIEKSSIPNGKLDEFKSHIFTKMSLKDITEKHGDTLVATGYDDQVLGVVSKQGDETVVLYDKVGVISQKVSEIESEEDYEEDPDYPSCVHAMEDYSYNFIGGYLGPRTWKCATLFTEDE